MWSEAATCYWYASSACNAQVQGYTSALGWHEDGTLGCPAVPSPGAHLFFVARKQSDVLFVHADDWSWGLDENQAAQAVWLLTVTEPFCTAVAKWLAGEKTALIKRRQQRYVPRRSGICTGREEKRKVTFKVIHCRSTLRLLAPGTIASKKQNSSLSQCK